MTALMKAVIVGAGQAGRQHAAAISRTPGLSLVGVADADPAAAGALADEYQVRVLSPDQALSGSHCDAVSLCIPPGGRSENVVQALGNGLAVMVEKPAALSPDELTRIGSASDLTGLPVAVMQQHRMAVLPYLQDLDMDWSMATAVCRTSRHRPAAHYLSQGWRSDPQLSGGGVLAHLAVHYLDLACQLLGPPDRVEASLRFDHPELPGIDTRATLGVSYAGGAMLVASATTLARQQEDELLIETRDLRLRVLRGAIDLKHAGEPILTEKPDVPALRVEIYREFRQMWQRATVLVPWSDIRRSAGSVHVLRAALDQQSVTSGKGI